MLNNESKTDTINEKIQLLEKSVSFLFNDSKIGSAAQKAIETLEFKDDTEIICDLSYRNNSSIVSNMTNILKKELQIEWNHEQQNTFYSVLDKIFIQNMADSNTIINLHDIKNSNGNKGKRKGFLVLGGSYNPCHTEHVELLHEIKRHLEEHENFIIIAAYLVVTSDGYVMGKLYENAMKHQHRQKICELSASKYAWCHASHVPMVSAKQYARMITMENSFDKYFGSNPLISESELDELIAINCWGADRMYPSYIASYKMRSSTKSMTACIGRKGYSEDIKEAYDKAKKKGHCNGFFYIDSECKPISSTLIREHLLKLRDALCTKKKGGDGWRRKISINNKHKRVFRENVKDMLHSDAIEYLIDNIADVWLSESSVYGRGKPFVVKANSGSGNKRNCSSKKKKWWHVK